MILKKFLANLPWVLNRFGLDIKSPRWWFEVLIIALFYILYIWIADKIPVSKYGSVFWPPAGLMIGFLLIWGRSRWLGLFLGKLGSQYLISLPVFLSIIVAVGSTLGALISVTLILRFTRTKYPLRQVRNVVGFIVCSVFTGTIVQSLIGAAVTCLGGFNSWNIFWEVFWNWWIGDAIGILVFTPLVLTWAQPRRDSQIKSWLNLEAFIVLASLIIVVYLALIKSLTVEYLLLPPLLWSAFRFGAKTTTLLVTIISVGAVITTAYKVGVFYDVALKTDSLLLLQLFIGVIAITTMAVLAIVSENIQAAIRLQKANAELEQRVLARTIDLQKSEMNARELATKAGELATKAEAANNAKSTFLANMSHELRSPLNAVIGFSQLMIRTKNLPTEQYENASIIHHSGEYLLTLINNVLDFSKIEAGKTTLNKIDFDLYQLLDNLEDMLHLQAANAGLELIFDLTDDLPRYIYTDNLKLRQVLINLLGNAIKFTHQGEVILSVNSIENKMTKEYALNFSIRDTGVGIPATELDKLFEAFSQTESGQDAQEGTGLGLAISRQFVQLMGGNITVESYLGKGTTFNFSILAQLGKEAIGENFDKRRVIALAPNQPTYKLLAVDDKPINCQLLIKLLTPLGFEMKEANNGQEAIAIWDEWEPHLIWMDMRMPVMDGYEATKFIKAHVKGSATAVIALTASVLEEEKAIVMSAGCDDFVRKPFKEHTIFETLTKHLGVQYIYEELVTEDIIISNRSNPVLTSTDLAVMSDELRSQLCKAAVEADSNRVMQLIKEIPKQESHLVKVLKKQTSQYEFDEMVELLS